MAKNPQKQNKLREEINSLPLDKNGVLTPTSFQNIPYLRACYKESLRVLPTAPGIIRSAGQDLQIDGYHVPKGVSEMRMNFIDGIVLEFILLLLDGFTVDGFVNG